MSTMEGHEVISFGVDVMGLYGAFFTGVKELNDWITEKPGSPDPMIDSLNRVHAKLNEINDLTLATWVTQREDNIAFLLAHATSALQTANAFLQSGEARSDPEWSPRLAIAERDSFIAVQTFTGDLEEGFWLRPDSVKAISWAGDPTSFQSGWMVHMPDRAEHHSFSRVWDYRWALPVAVYAISARIVVIHTVGFDDNAIHQEVQRYNTFIAKAFQKMESGVRSVGTLTPKQIQNIPTQGVPVAVADIYGGYYIGGLCDPFSMYTFTAKDLPKPPGFVTTNGSLESILDSKEKFTRHWSDLIKIKIGLPELLQFAGRLENILKKLETKSDKILALKDIGIDFSVPEEDLKNWLNNPSFTPYPAIAEALLKLVGNKRLRQPVFIDVIVSNYEQTPGVSSPRKLEDVDLATLKEAIVDSYNNRYGESISDFQSIL
ncbi:hypothetical protein [Candidatus Nitrosocosmicus sp. R]